MILRLQILWLLLLSACSTLPSLPKSASWSDQAPAHWQASGRLSVAQGEVLSSYRFHLQVRDDDFELLLSDTLGFSQFKVERQSKQLLVNQQAVAQNFNDWSLSHLGWSLSPAQLARVLFTGDTQSSDWQISIRQYQQIQQTSRPKLLQLDKEDAALTIKLLFTDINS